MILSQKNKHALKVRLVPFKMVRILKILSFCENSDNFNARSTRTQVKLATAKDQFLIDF